MDWLALVSILVIHYHQPLDVAWETTMQEFLMITDFKNRERLSFASKQGWDSEKIKDFEKHLQKAGIL